MRPMTNYDANVEFLKESMLEKGYAQFGLDSNGNIKLCDEMGCSECKFRDQDRSCREQRSEWLKQEAKPPIVEQVMDIVNTCEDDCINTTCESCTYHGIKPSCMARRIANALVYNFDVKNKED